MKVEMLKVTPQATEILYECSGEHATNAWRSYRRVLCDMCDINTNWRVCTGAYSITLYDVTKPDTFVISYQIHIID